MDEIKKNKLVFDEIEDKNITQLYDEKIIFNKEITEKYLEADFGIFCDMVLTRKFMIQSKQEIKDDNTLWILNGVELDDDEMELYNKYNLKK